MRVRWPLDPLRTVEEDTKPFKMKPAEKKVKCVAADEPAGRTVEVEHVAPPKTASREMKSASDKARGEKIPPSPLVFE